MPSCAATLATWLLLSALTLAAARELARECEAPECAALDVEAGAEEAGLLQVKSTPPVEGLDLVEVGGATEAPPEFGRALSLAEETGDPTPAYKALPSDMRNSLDALGSAVRGSRAGKAARSCRLHDASDCRMGDLSRSEFTSVVPTPGKWGTHCINPESEFLFQVYPGRSDRLLVYFQDGGACWDIFSASLPYQGTKGVCKEEVVEQDSVGVFDRTDEENPFRDFTVVHVNYCSGDAHAGNHAMPYGRQAGYNNSRAAVEWAKQNMDQRIDRLAIMGASAGALGAQVWARTLLSEFKESGRSYTRAVVVADSYLGYFPPHTQPHVLGPIFRTCDTPLGRGWSKTCGKTLTVQDAVMDTMKIFPDVPFLFVNSKADLVQRAFYSAIALTLQKLIVLLDEGAMYTAATAIFDAYSQNPNFAAFQVDGTQHMFLPGPRCARGQDEADCAGNMYDATPSGPFAGRHQGSRPRLVDWLAQAIGGKSMRSACKGSPVSRSIFNAWRFPLDACSKKVAHKRLILHKR